MPQSRMLQGGNETVGYVAGETDPDEGGGVEGGIREMLSPDTDLGQATIIAALSLVGLLLLLPKDGGLPKRVAGVFGFVALVLLAEWLGNYVVRLYAIRDTDRPLARGALFNT